MSERAGISTGLVPPMHPVVTTAGGPLSRHSFNMAAHVQAVSRAGSKRLIGTKKSVDEGWEQAILSCVHTLEHITTERKYLDVSAGGQVAGNLEGGKTLADADMGFTKAPTLDSLTPLQSLLSSQLHNVTNHKDDANGISAIKSLSRGARRELFERDRKISAISNWRRGETGLLFGGGAKGQERGSARSPRFRRTMSEGVQTLVQPKTQLTFQRSMSHAQNKSDGYPGQIITLQALFSAFSRTKRSADRTRASLCEIDGECSSPPSSLASSPPQRTTLLATASEPASPVGMHLRLGALSELPPDVDPRDMGDIMEALEILSPSRRFSDASLGSSGSLNILLKTTATTTTTTTTHLTTTTAAGSTEDYLYKENQFRATLPVSAPSTGPSMPEFQGTGKRHSFEEHEAQKDDADESDRHLLGAHNDKVVAHKAVSRGEDPWASIEGNTEHQARVNELKIGSLRDREPGARAHRRSSGEHLMMSLGDAAEGARNNSAPSSMDLAAMSSRAGDVERVSSDSKQGHGTSCGMLLTIDPSEPKQSCQGGTVDPNRNTAPSSHRPRRNRLSFTKSLLSLLEFSGSAGSSSLLAPSAEDDDGAQRDERDAIDGGVGVGAVKSLAASSGFAEAISVSLGGVNDMQSRASGASCLPELLSLETVEPAYVRPSIQNQPLTELQLHGLENARTAEAFGEDRVTSRGSEIGATGADMSSSFFSSPPSSSPSSSSSSQPVSALMRTPSGSRSPPSYTKAAALSRSIRRVSLGDRGSPTPSRASVSNSPSPLRRMESFTFGSLAVEMALPDESNPSPLGSMADTPGHTPRRSLAETSSTSFGLSSANHRPSLPPSSVVILSSPQSLSSMSSTPGRRRTSIEAIAAALAEEHTFV